MVKALLIAAKDIRSIIKVNKKLPIALILLFVVCFWTAQGLAGFFKQGIYIDKFDVAIVNKDSHPLSKVLVQQFSTEKNLTSLLNIIIVDREAQAESLVRENRAVAAVIIPPGFIDSVEVGENFPIVLITNSAHPLKSEMIKSLMDSYVRNVSAGQSAVNAVWDYYGQTDMTARQRRQKIDMVITDVTLKAMARNNLIHSTTLEGINSIPPTHYYLASGIIVILLFITLALSRGMVEEINNRVTDRISLSNISKGSYLFGKFLGIFASGAVFIILFYILGSVVLMGGLGSVPYHYLGILLCCHFAASGLAILFGTLIKSPSVMEMGGNTIIFTMAIVGGGVIPYIYLPTIIAKMAPLTINYWAVR